MDTRGCFNHLAVINDAEVVPFNVGVLDAARYAKTQVHCEGLSRTAQVLSVPLFTLLIMQAGHAAEKCCDQPVTRVDFPRYFILYLNPTPKNRPVACNINPVECQQTHILHS